MIVCLACITRNKRTVINEVEQTTSMAGQDGLLLGALNDSRQVEIIGLLELLSRLQMR